MSAIRIAFESSIAPKAIFPLVSYHQFASRDLQYMIVYLRDVADYHPIQKYIHLRFPNVPALIVEARVCRPEWLIEVECVATRSLACTR